MSFGNYYLSFTPSDIIVFGIVIGIIALIVQIAFIVMFIIQFINVKKIKKDIDLIYLSMQKKD